MASSKETLSNETVAAATGSSSSTSGNMLPVAESAIMSLIKGMASKASIGPAGAKEANRPANERGPFAVDEKDGQLYVAVPSNLESFSDDTQGIAFAAAFHALRAQPTEIACAKEWPIPQKLTDDRKVIAQYFSGIANAIRHAELHEPPKVPYSGAYGDGFYWVISTNLEQYNLQTTYLKSKGVSPSMYLAKHGWGKTIPEELNRLVSFLRRACRSLKLRGMAKHYLKGWNSLVGHGIKRSMPWSQGGVLNQVELDAIAQKYHAANERYDALKAEMSGPIVDPIAFYQQLPEKNRSIAEALQPASLLVDRITTKRFNALTKNKSKREVQAESKLPIAVRIDQADKSTQLCGFTPLQLVNQEFHIAESDQAAFDKGDEKTVQKVHEQYHKAIMRCADLVVQNVSLEHELKIFGSVYEKSQKEEKSSSEPITTAAANKAAAASSSSSSGQVPKKGKLPFSALLQDD